MADGLSTIQAIQNLNNTLTGIGNMRAQKLANATNLQIARETNQANLELANTQYQNDLKMWELNNAYNTPSAQMERYKEAGLNPYLIYGSGGSAGNSSSYPTFNASVARQQSPEVRAVQMQFQDFLSTYLPVLSFYQQTQLNESKIKNDETYRQLLLSQISGNNARTALSVSQKAFRDFENSKLEERYNRESENYNRKAFREAIANQYFEESLKKKLNLLDSTMGIKALETAIKAFQVQQNAPWQTFTDKTGLPKDVFEGLIELGGKFIPGLKTIRHIKSK